MAVSIMASKSRLADIFSVSGQVHGAVFRGW
jgi:hypothetical protein